jgi:hypothetical protein
MPRTPPMAIACLLATRVADDGHHSACFDGHHQARSATRCFSMNSRISLNIPFFFLHYGEYSLPGMRTSPPI